MNSPNEPVEKSTGGASTAKWVLLGIVIFVVSYFIGPHLPTSHKKVEWMWRPFAAGAFEISVPASWQPVQRADSDLLCLVDPQNNLNMTARADVKADSLAELSALSSPLVPADASLMDLSGLFAIYHQRAWTEAGGSVDNITTAAISDNSVDVVLTGNNKDGVPIWFHCRYIELGPYCVIVRVWTTPRSYEKHQDTLTQIVDSVRPIR